MAMMNKDEQDLALIRSHFRIDPLEKLLDKKLQPFLEAREAEGKLLYQIFITNEQALGYPAQYKELYALRTPARERYEAAYQVYFAEYRMARDAREKTKDGWVASPPILHP